MEFLEKVHSGNIFCTDCGGDEMLIYALEEVVYSSNHHGWSMVNPETEPVTIITAVKCYNCGKILGKDNGLTTEIAKLVSEKMLEEK